MVSPRNERNRALAGMESRMGSDGWAVDRCVGL